MKKAITLSLAVFLVVSVLVPCKALAAPDNSADAVILIDADTGQVLYEENADEKMSIASTTKIMTALVVLENCGLDEQVLIKDEYTYVEGSSMYLQPGEKLTVRDLLYGLLLASGNDAAVALACHTSGSVEAFAQLMNEKAAELGCANSSFKNPHGLDEEGHYCTARDLAMITSAALVKKEFAEIAATKSMTISGRSYTNHNKLLWYYDGIVGVKTGYTSTAGRTLVSCVSRGGMKLICVTLSDPDDWDDHMNLYDWALDNFTKYSVLSSDSSFGPAPVISGMADTVKVFPEQDIAFIADNEDEVDISVSMSKFFYAPVNKGDQAGMITVTVNGEAKYKIGLVFGESVSEDASVPLTRWERLKRTLSGWF